MNTSDVSGGEKVDIKTTNYSLLNLGSINIVMGKNGCGKSTALREVEQSGRDKNIPYKVTYVTPERGGVPKVAPGIEDNMVSNVNWTEQVRAVNFFGNFREQAAIRFLDGMMRLLQEVQDAYKAGTAKARTTDVVVAEINTLLDNVVFRFEGRKLVFTTKAGTLVDENKLSSGEKELLTIAFEIFFAEIEQVTDVKKLVVLDEPDAHLHPDLQARLCALIAKISKERAVNFLIASHSTSIAASLAGVSDARICFMTGGMSELRFKPITESLQRIVPAFGAHPLSAVFNKKPLLLVEGEDDERIWQQAVRSSNGRLRLYPISVDTNTKLNEHELQAQAVLGSVYDDPKAFSLRDRDEVEGDITDLPPVTRLRLSCRNAENLLLTDEVLLSQGLSWNEFSKRLVDWAATQSNHKYHSKMMTFISEGFNRKFFDVKDIRLILVDQMGTNKPWEVIVGQVIAGMCEPRNHTNSETGLKEFLGAKVMTHLFS